MHGFSQKECNMIQDKVEKYIRKHNLLSPESRVLIGVSGGADSVALLLLLKNMGFHVVAAHCNFHLRGDESIRDELFVENLCRVHDVEYIKTDFDTKAVAQQRGISIEMAARDLRYAFFDEARMQHACSAVAVAHHQDDNVETILLNLMRGTGIKGLCGIQPKKGFVIRPFLCLRRDEITAWLDSIGQHYVTDSTNLIPDVERNKVRLQLIPLLRQMKTSSIGNILRASENLQETRLVYDAAISSYINLCLTPDGCHIKKDVLLSSPSPLSILHELLSPLGFNRSQLTDLVHSFNHIGSSFESATHVLVVGRNCLELESKEELERLRTREIAVEDIISLETADRANPVAFDPSPSVAYFDADKLKGHLQVRLARKGDQIVPFGMKGRKLVSDLLTDLKISSLAKQKQLVLLSGDTIAWVIGRRTSDLFRVDDTTRRMIIARVKKNQSDL